MNEYHLGNIIDGCGKYFRNLILHTQYKKKLTEPWEAVPNKKLLPNAKSQKGKTPGEALYKLMVEINKQNEKK